MCASPVVKDFLPHIHRSHPTDGLVEFAVGGVRVFSDGRKQVALVEEG